MLFLSIFRLSEEKLHWISVVKPPIFCYSLCAEKSAAEL